MPTRSPLLVAALAALLTGCAPLGEPILYAPGPDGPALPRLAAYGPIDPAGWADIPLVEHRPVSGGTMALAPDNTTLVVGEPDHDVVYVVDLSRDRIRGVLATPGEPGRVTISPDGHRAYVVLRRAGAVVVVDLTTVTVPTLVRTCPSPRGIALQNAGTRLHVACLGGALETYDTDDGRRLRRVAVAPDLRDVVVLGDTVMVSRFRAAELIALDDDGRIAWRRRPPVHDARTPAVAWRTLAGSDGRVYMLHQMARTRVRAADRQLGDRTPPPFFGDYRNRDAWGSRRRGRPCEQVVVPTITRFTAQGDPEGSIALPTAELAIDMALSADMERVDWPPIVVTSSVDLSNVGGTPTTVSVPTWVQWSGWYCDEDGDGGSPDNWGPATSVVQPVGRDTIVQMLGHGRLDGTSLTLPRTAVRRSLVGVGWWTMHHGTTSGLACATCHPEGSEDGLVWHFGDAGPARTQDLRGGIGDSAPFHWRQDMADMDAIVADMMVDRMGVDWAGSPATRREIAGGLTAWLDSLSAPVVDPIEPGDVEHGAAIFDRAGCAGCHSGPRHSDGLRHDVGTGEALETPTLVGVGRRARLMHDGCADDLRGRFDPDCGGRRHGDVDGLSAADLDDLIAFLATL